MDFWFLIKGIVIGILVSAPLGPIGVLCIQRTLNRGVFSGVISGMGAMFADTLYAVIAAYGLSIISDFLNEYQVVLRVVGSAVLVFLGFRIFLKHPRNMVARHRPSRTRHVSDFVSVFFLTLSNPVTIFGFTFFFASIGLKPNAGIYETGLLVAGVAAGAVIWWSVLVLIINLFRKRIRLRNLWWINKITGILIIILGVVVILSVFVSIPGMPA